MTRLAIPLLSYFAVTTLVPVLSGIRLDDALLDHALVAIALPIAIAGALGLLVEKRELFIDAVVERFIQREIEPRVGSVSTAEHRSGDQPHDKRGD